MEAIHPHSHDPDGEAAEPADPLDPARCDAGVLEYLSTLPGHTGPTDALLAQAVERIVTLLDLSGATLSLITEEAGVSQLSPVASAGAHAVFARDMSARPLESLADAATAIAEQRPVFVADVHSVAGAPEAGTGVGRWRAGVSAHSTAVLPVSAWGVTSGVLTVEWPGSRPFGDEERVTLEGAAALLGLLVEGTLRAREEQAQPGTEARPPLLSAAYGMSGDGVTFPLGEGEGADAEARIFVASRIAGPDDAPLWDVSGTGPASAAIVCGVATVPGGGEALAAECSRNLRLFASQGAGPADSLLYLSRTLRASAPAAGRVSVAACMVERVGSAVTLTVATAGSLLTAVRGSSGQLSLETATPPALSSAHALRPASRHVLLLPGDRCALVCGQVAELVAGEHREAVRGALDAGKHTGHQAAEALLGLLGETGRAGTVVVVER